MMHNRPFRGGGIGKASNGTDAADSTAPGPSFHRLLAQQLHPVWVYRLRGEDECRVVFPNGATRDEVLAVLERKFAQPVQYAKPVLGGGE